MVFRMWIEGHITVIMILKHNLNSTNSSTD